MKTVCLTNPLTKNDFVKQLQKALKKAGLYGGPIDGVFGKSTADACFKAKWRLGYPKRAVNHCGGQQLLDYLHGVDKLPLTFLARRHIRGYGLTRAEKQRNVIVDHARWGIRNSGQIHYAQVRPMDKLHQVRPLPWWADCSEFVTTIYCWAGAPDPNDLNYNGTGNTDTMYNAGVFIPLWDAKPGDVVIWRNYGGWGTHHTAIIIDTTNKADPTLASHGQEAGPLEISLHSEHRAQAGRSYVVKRYIKD